MFFVFEKMLPIEKLGSFQAYSKKFDCIAGYTFFGDLFLFDSSTKQYAVLYVMPPELSELNFYGSEFGDKFLSHEIVKQDLLKVTKANAIVERIGGLVLGDVLIPNPYPFLGGDESIDSYSKGNIWVFLEIISSFLIDPDITDSVH